MAYKKYIKRGGKTYGPYIYHSRRVNGKVVSEYRGSSSSFDYKKYVWPTLMIIVLLGLIFGFSALDKNWVSGNVVMDLGANYLEGQPLEGNLRLLLTEGELMPSESKIIFETANTNYGYSLNELISDEPIEGNYYISGKSLLGSGPGFGIAGQGALNPTIYFSLKIVSTSETSAIEEQIDAIIEDVNESGAISLGDVVSNFFLSLTPTGNVVLESNNEIQGEVSSQNNYVLSLSDNQTAELISGSVRTENFALEDEIITLSQEGNNIIITTDYSEGKTGFGKDYLGSTEKVLEIPLENLNMVFEPGELKVSVVYGLEEIVSLSTTLEGKISEEQQVIQTPVSEIIDEEVSIAEPTQQPTTELKGLPIGLTDLERNILLARFGDQEIEKKKDKKEEKRITIRYELGDYWYKATYDTSLSKEELKIQMDNDQEKWLRDIATSLSSSGSSEDWEILE